MDILLEQDEIDYKRYVCNSEVLFDNVDRLLNCMEMLTTAVEYPEKRGFWYLLCNGDLPVSDELFPSLLKEHFGDVKMSTFCVSALDTEQNVRCVKFQNDCLHHFRQLNKEQIFALPKKLLFALDCLQIDLKM